MSKPDQAVAAFGSQRNCSQAVLSTYSPALGLAEESALKVAAAFGGGMGHTGLTCGAVTGALMTIGLHCGNSGQPLNKMKEQAYCLAVEFLKRFEQQHGSTACRTLINFDISTPQSFQTARKNGVFDSLCPGFVRTACEILESILEEQAS